MPITPENIAVHELIGLHAKVKESLSLPHRGLEGTVVDETKNTLVLETGKGEKAVPKKGCVFEFSLPGGARAELEGSKIAFRSYDRPKKLKRE
ncbi:Ribonuclease P protein component 1 [uncultured archaeon]|nr:Ribonuclease P protein component 1 [uncultured archaeon]